MLADKAVEFMLMRCPRHQRSKKSKMSVHVIGMNSELGYVGSQAGRCQPMQSLVEQIKAKQRETGQVAEPTEYVIGT